jgi:hypothetical protein
MRLRSLGLIALVGALVAVAIVVLIQLVGTPLVAPPDAPVAVVPLPGVAVVPAGPDPTGGMHWNDPSVDPELLRRAFAPPPTNLPPEALPRASSIHPPREALKRLQSKGAVAY